ncbi:MAG: type II toxin-antitoxin system VapC family toxin [Nitrospirota bacterium]|nr:type II toxin-antitoxin system VapC family toxin [Nitrospirota bacterium]
MIMLQNRIIIGKVGYMRWSVLNRRIQEKRLSQRDYARIKQHFSDDVRDAMIINLIPEVIATSTKLLEASPLRAMDALHVACAIVWRADLFVSSDKQQVAAAGKAGLKIKYV